MVLVGGGREVYVGAVGQCFFSPYFFFVFEKNQKSARDTNGLAVKKINLARENYCKM